MIAAFPRRRGLWERFIALVSSPFDRPTPGYPSQGILQAGQLATVDGAKVGDVKYAFGTAASVVRDNPGWAIADGTATVVIDGVSYSPNLTGSFIIGADGGSFAVGSTGGSASLSNHGHAFTQPTAHADHSHTGHSAPTAHGITQPAVNSHAGAFTGFTEVLTTPGTNQWVPYGNSAANAAAALAHALGTNVALSNNHAALDHNHDNATLNNNHSGGAVGNATGSPTQYPPFVAVWPLLKVR